MLNSPPRETQERALSTRITKTVVNLTNALRFLYSNPLVINAYVSMDDRRVRSVNWGDDINFHFIKHLTKRDIVIYFDTPAAMALKRANYLCIGSTLNYLTTPETIVWGAGVIDSNIEMRAAPARIHAVRGPLTREHLLSRGIQCPEVYGDPALLIPYFYRPETTSKGERGRRICIIPHYADQDSAVLARIKAGNPDIGIIDIANYGTWTHFISEICKYDAVLSSSLHGLVIAEAYGIANHWVRISDKVIGHGFKFRDFYASIGKSIADPIVLDATSDPDKVASAHPWTLGSIDLTRLLDACPFKIKEPVRYPHPMDTRAAPSSRCRRPTNPENGPATILSDAPSGSAALAA